MTEQSARALIDLRTLRRVQITCLAGLSYAGLSAELWENAVAYSDPFDLIDLFSLSHETNLPTWFASAQLLLCSLAAAAVAIATRQRSGRYVAHWWGLAAAFGYISIDETVQIHEQMNHWFETGGVLYFGWVIPAAVIVGLFVLSYIGFLGHLPRRTRNRFVLAGAIFVGGALGVELGLGYWTDLEGDQNLVYALIDWVEESMELCGIALMLYSIIEYEIGDAAMPATFERKGLAAIGAVWTLLLIVGGAVVATGLSPEFDYEDKRGNRLHRDRYLGEDLSDEMRGGQRFVYVGERKVFDQNPEARLGLLIALGGTALIWTTSRLTSTTNH